MKNLPTKDKTTKFHLGIYAIIEEGQRILLVKMILLPSSGGKELVKI